MVVVAVAVVMGLARVVAVARAVATPVTVAVAPPPKNVEQVIYEYVDRLRYFR